jgi:hypothetical protein
MSAVQFGASVAVGRLGSLPKGDYGLVFSDD